MQCFQRCQPLQLSKDPLVEFVPNHAMKSLIGLGKSMPEHIDLFQALKNKLYVQSVKRGPFRDGPRPFQCKNPHMMISHDRLSSGEKSYDVALIRPHH